MSGAVIFWKTVKWLLLSCVFMKSNLWNGTKMAVYRSRKLYEFVESTLRHKDTYTESESVSQMHVTARRRRKLKCSVKIFVTHCINIKGHHICVFNCCLTMSFAKIIWRRLKVVTEAIIRPNSVITTCLTDRENNNNNNNNNNTSFERPFHYEF
jgi:hypothetical protein